MGTREGSTVQLVQAVTYEFKGMSICALDFSFMKPNWDCGTSDYSTSEAPSRRIFVNMVMPRTAIIRSNVKPGPRCR